MSRQFNIAALWLTLALMLAGAFYGGWVGVAVVVASLYIYPRIR